MWSSIPQRVAPDFIRVFSAARAPPTPKPIHCRRLNDCPHYSLIIPEYQFPSPCPASWKHSTAQLPNPRQHTSRQTYTQLKTLTHFNFGTIATLLHVGCTSQGLKRNFSHPHTARSNSSVKTGRPLRALNPTTGACERRATWPCAVLRKSRFWGSGLWILGLRVLL